MIPKKMRGIITADKRLMERVERALYKVHNWFPVVFDHEEGVKFCDTEGDEYLNFGADAVVMALEYGDEEHTEAVEGQLHELIHISDLFYNQLSIEAGEKLLQVSHMGKMFFTSSGTEAIEGALKIAKHYHYNKLHETMGSGCDDCEDAESDVTGEIIIINHSFHGKSLGALSVTGNAHYQEPFKPLIPGIRFADFDDLGNVKKLVNSKICAVITGTVQGEGGIYSATEEFTEGVRALCDEHDLLLILDEIQCGIGRSGEMFAWQHYGVKPNVIAVAKALRNGPPVGTLLAQGRTASAMIPGDYGATYGGNPLVMVGVNTMLDIFKKHRITEHVKGTGAYLYGKLEELSKELDCTRVHRGTGLIQRLELFAPTGPIVSKALLGQKLVLISAGTSIIRFIPPLVIGRADMDEMMKRLRVAAVE